MWLLEAETRANNNNIFMINRQNNSNNDVTQALTSLNYTVLYDFLAYAMYAQGNPEHAAYYSRLLNDIGKKLIKK
jgi:hypothetical protein